MKKGAKTLTQYSNNDGVREPYIGMPINLNDGYDEHMWHRNGNMNGNNNQGNNQGNMFCQNWPIAMAYVPMQQWKTPFEDLSTALNVGTIFPELDLPLRGYAYKGGMRK